MNRELLLLRHGKSRWDTGHEDFHRPLKDRGKRGAQRIGNWLLQQGLLPDLVVSSPATRALETAGKACKVMGISAKTIEQKNAIYEADVDQLLEIIRAIPEDRSRVLLVGHNPGLEELLQYLSNKPVEWPNDDKLLPTATLARLDMHMPWSHTEQGSASLQVIIRPRTLPKRFPWPAMGGSEWRDRPAYYYQQSSAIPYRMLQDRLEILIIRSSQDKHWVVPKGIIDPGLTPQASAAKEALEEAGVTGVIAETALGSYDYEKWGAVCSVTVYAMHVEDIIPKAEWAERHRSRRWISPVEAGDLLRQKELVPMIEALVDRLKQNEDA